MTEEIKPAPEEIGITHGEEQFEAKNPERQIVLTDKAKKYITDEYLNYQKFAKNLDDDFVCLYPKLSAKENSPIIKKEIWEFAYHRQLHAEIKTTKSKYNTKLKRFLFDFFSEEAKAIVEIFENQKGNLTQKDLFEESIVDKKFHFQKTKERFFTPLLEREKNASLLGRYDMEKKSLSRDLEAIN